MDDIRRAAQNMGFKIHPEIWHRLHCQFGEKLTLVHIVLFLLEDKSREIERQAVRRY